MGRRPKINASSSDAQNLHNLTHKIEGKLREQSHQSAGQNLQKQISNQPSSGRDADVRENQPNRPAPTFEGKGSAQKRGAVVKWNAQKHHGKKRYRNGEVKSNVQSSKKTSKPHPFDSQVFPGIVKDVSTDFQNEVLSFGGTQADIDLVEAAESESEIEGGETLNISRSEQNSSLDVPKIIRQLGLDKMSAVDVFDVDQEIEDQAGSVQHAIQNVKSTLQIDAQSSEFGKGELVCITNGLPSKSLVLTNDIAVPCPPRLACY